MLLKIFVLVDEKKSPFTRAENEENVYNCLKAVAVKSLVLSDSASNVNAADDSSETRQLPARPEASVDTVLSTTPVAGPKGG